MKTPVKLLLILLCSLAYVIAVTYLSEYTVNEVSSTWVTVAGAVAFIILTWLFILFILKVRKK